MTGKLRDKKSELVALSDTLRDDLAAECAALSGGYAQLVQGVARAVALFRAARLAQRIGAFVRARRGGES